jgi:hypothetical protein
MAAITPSTHRLASKTMRHAKHPLTAAFLVLLTRFSIGSLRLTEPAVRRRLAREIRAARRRLQADWQLHSYTGPFRIFEHWAPRPV